MNAYRLVNRPYYLFRPAQALARLRRGDAVAAPGEDGTSLVRTAWGSAIHCWPDSLGRAVARTGVYDLPVAETLARLADPGETAVDAGANVGLMTNLLAHAVGPGGRVVSFEPHPLVHGTLRRNVARLRDVDRLDVVTLRQAAVSAERGTLPLRIDPQTFSYNKGTASLQPTGDAGAPGESVDVETVRLDDELTGPIGVIKLDVEMHELQALEGAEALLRGGEIRDIVFEEHEPPPTPVTELLTRHGYTIIGVRQGVLRPLASEPLDAYRRQLWDPPALLATREPRRARERLRRFGWRALRRDLARRGG